MAVESIRNELREFKKVRQEGEGYRRLFTDDCFDLYIWYSSQTELTKIGFQLTYDKNRAMNKVITWSQGSLYHSRIDEEGRFDPSPVLSENLGPIDEKVIAEFKIHTCFMDEDIVNYVLDKLHQNTGTGVLFPIIFKCPICSKKLKSGKSGQFRCSECKIILAIDKTGRVLQG